METTTNGIDVSHYQGDVQWEEVKGAGYGFAYAKCTEGTTYTDPRFKENWEGIGAAGLLRGAYHFYDSTSEGTAQAEHFLQVMGAITTNDMAPMLDLEVFKASSVSEYQGEVLNFLKTVEQATGRKPIIYTAPSFGDRYLNVPAFGEYPLWIAEYGVEAPRVPEAWKSEGKSWNIWQNNSKASVPGINGNVDHDIFKGNLEGLLQL